MSAEVFRSQQESLSASFRVIVPDLRGHGDSGTVAPGQGIETLSEDLVALLQHLELDSVVLVGWSMGAMVGWGIIRQARERVAAMVVVDMVPRILSDESWPFGIKQGKDASVFQRAIAQMSDNWPDYTRIFVPRIFAANGSDQHDLIDSICRIASRNHAESMAILWRSMAEQDFRSMVRELDLPVLVIYGRHSQLYRPAAARWLADALPRATLVEFSQSGHAPSVEEPEYFNQVLSDFVRGLTPGDAPNPATLH